MPEVDLFLIRPSDTLRRAAETIDRNRCGIALIVDEGRRLLGTVTDGEAAYVAWQAPKNLNELTVHLTRINPDTNKRTKTLY